MRKMKILTQRMILNAARMFCKINLISTKNIFKARHSRLYDTKSAMQFYLSQKSYKEVKPRENPQQSIIILLDNSDKVIEQPSQIRNEAGGSEEVVVLDGEEVEVEVEVENDEEEDTIEGLQIPDKALNDRARKMLKMKNPKSSRKINGVTKRTKARKT